MVILKILSYEGGRVQCGTLGIVWFHLPSIVFHPPHPPKKNLCKKTPRCLGRQLAVSSVASVSLHRSLAMLGHGLSFPHNPSVHFYVLCMCVWMCMLAQVGEPLCGVSPVPSPFTQVPGLTQDSRLYPLSHLERNS